MLQRQVLEARLSQVGSPQPPQLLNVTVAYVDDVPGELPNEVKLFAQGNTSSLVPSSA